MKRKSRRQASKTAKASTWRPAARSKSSQRTIWKWTGATALPIFLAFSGFVGFLEGYGQKDRARPAQAIVILGSRVEPSGAPGISLRGRTMHAVRLYKRGLAPKIICTGGTGTYPPAEAKVAATLAIQQGVPADDVLLEDTSTSTWENARNTARICKAHGWKRVIVVSDPYHLWRARRDFEKCGLTAFPSPAASQQWRSQPWWRLLWTCREALLVLRDLIALR